LPYPSSEILPTGTFLPALQPSTETRTRTTSSRAALVIALVVFGMVFIANAWVGDDAFISFRVSDNLAHGFGPRWNVVERVQAFTNPLWMFLMAGAELVTGELFYTSMVVSFGLCLALVIVMWRWLARDADRWLALALLLSSKAFIDYTSSGLEYALSYLLLTAFVTLLLRPDAEEWADDRRVRLLTLIAALAFVNRADTILLYLPALVWLVASRIRRMRWRDLRGLVLAAAPAWGWLLFALIYFGFPFPNTYYAKVYFGAPHWLQIRQGLAYVASCLRFDTVTIATIVAAVGICWTTGTRMARVTIAGAAAYVLYTVWVGGDFMAGRFFSLPFLMSTLLLARAPKKQSSAYAAVGLLVVLNVVNPIAPLKTIPSSDIGWPWRLQNGVKDERGATYKGVSPLTYEVFRVMPDNFLAREGRSMSASSERVFVHPWIGMIGYYAGPSKYIIDPNALSDPLLARLPVGQEFYFAFWVSHWTRTLPDGYVESRRAGAGQNLIVDPRIHRFFDRILNVTEGPVFSVSRFRDIIALNWGRYRHFNEEIKRTLRLDYVAGVDNPLFTTDVGELAHAQMKSSGKAGYVLLGPGIPLETGTYRVRWNATIDGSAGSDLGFVQVCASDCRTVIATAPIDGTRAGVIAEVIARLPRDVRDIEYRVFVTQGTRITLQSVAITQE
jgi:arabinofuranosyltransferase